MKTLHISTFVLLLAGIFFACTKDDSTLSAANASKVKPEVVTGADKKPVLAPVMYLTADALKTPVTSVEKGESVTITYTAKDPITGVPVDCGTVKIFRLKDDGTWEEVASHNAPTVTFTFPAEVTGDCAYSFKASFAPGGGPDGTSCGGDYAGVGEDTQTPICVKVTSDCPETFTVYPDVDAKEVEPGLYEFTITYVLKSPEAMENVKFQGGATSGGQFKHELVEGSLVGLTKLDKNQNTVLTWTGNLTPCEPVTLSFKYRRKFSCPEDANSAVTGQWSASGGGLAESYVVAPLTYSCEQ